MRTAITGLIGANRSTTFAGLIVLIAMIVMAAGCGTGYEDSEDTYREPSRPTSSQPVNIGATRVPQTINDSSGSQAPSSRYTPSPSRPATSSDGYNTAPSGPTSFADYRQAGWVWADQDNMSTFSLDTDRTSFALALNWAQSGYEIDPDSVRAEEWINSFNYDYDEPSNDGSFGITSDVFEHPVGQLIPDDSAGVPGAGSAV